MSELNFCPYCDAPQQKVVTLNGDETFFFCKTCNRFFNLMEKKLKCIKCNSTKVEDSDFPTPDGQMVFQCMACKKMFSGSEFLQKNLKS